MKLVRQFWVAMGRDSAYSPHNIVRRGSAPTVLMEMFR